MKLQNALCRAVHGHLNGEPVRLPTGANVLWSAFIELSLSRSMGPRGPNPISFSDIQAWTHLMHMPLEPRHVKTLLSMDQVFMEHTYRRLDAPEGVKPLPPRSKHKITAEMFDLTML